MAAHRRGSTPPAVTFRPSPGTCVAGLRAAVGPTWASSMVGNVGNEWAMEHPETAANAVRPERDKSASEQAKDEPAADIRNRRSSLVMKGPGVRVPPSASQSPCILAGFGAARWIVIGVDEADWAMRHVGGGSLVRFGLDRRRAWVRANGRPRSSGSRGEASRIRLLDLGQATRLAPGSTGPTGAASCAARVGSIPSPLAVARRRPASSACA
jgi:hypothetical protein